MSIKPHIKNIGILASVLGVVQGLGWIMLSIFVILIYQKTWEPEISKSTYGEELNYMLFSRYLNVDDKSPDVIITCDGLFICSIVYLIMSLIWVGLSVNVFVAFNGNKVGIITQGFQIWSIATLLTCTLDAVVTILLVVDYNYVLSKVNPLNPVDLYTILSVGIVMTLAARGFILWLVNFGLATVLFCISRSLQLECVNDTANASDQRDVGHTNPAFVPEREKPSNPNANPPPSVKPETAPKPKPVKPTPYPKPPPPPQQPAFTYPNDRFAKIGPTSKSPPPLKVQPPQVPSPRYIYPTEPRVPSPDYSPPNSPFNSQLKSALKNRSQYDFDNNNIRF